jgi:hypothetical protein
MASQFANSISTSWLTRVVQALLQASLYIPVHGLGILLKDNHSVKEDRGATERAHSSFSHAPQVPAK